MDPFEKLKHMKTLLVDDDGLIRDSLSMAFLSRGCNIKTVESAEKGIEVLQKEHFDIIVSDFKLPGMNGMEFFEKAGLSRAGSVNVLISGNVREEDLEGKEALGIDEFLEKPFTVMTLAGMLAGLIEGRENVSSTTN
ncbi:MAG: response regulator [Thermodesulfobacteriota bacterium]